MRGSACIHMPSLGLSMPASWNRAPSASMAICDTVGSARRNRNSLSRIASTTWQNVRNNNRGSCEQMQITHRVGRIKYNNDKESVTGHGSNKPQLFLAPLITHSRASQNENQRSQAGQAHMHTVTVQLTLSSACAKFFPKQSRGARVNGWNLIDCGFLPENTTGSP